MIVHSPDLPYWELIPDAGQTGSLIVIEGQVPRTANRFAVDIVIGDSLDSSDESKDIALHLNPRINENRIVCNSRTKGRWGSEEYSKLLIRRETPFKITIHVLSMRFKIMVNEESCCTFNHRLPKDEIGLIHISGDVVIDRLSCESLLPESQPPPKPVRCDMFRPGSHAISYTQSLGVPVTLDAVDGLEQKNNDPLVITNPVLPMHQKMDGLKPGDVITVRGTPLPSFDRFALDLGQSGTRVIALHVNPRYKERVVVRNSRSADGWQEEERVSPFFPFTSVKDFTLEVRVMHDRFVILINERTFADFKFRILPIDSIDLISLCGDVEVASVQITKS